MSREDQQLKDVLEQVKGAVKCLNEMYPEISLGELTSLIAAAAIKFEIDEDGPAYALETVDCIREEILEMIRLQSKAHMP